VNTPEIRAIEDRAKAASNETWMHMCLGSDGCVVIPDARNVRERGRRIAMFGHRDWQGDHRNAEFVAHARKDIPALIAEVRRLQAALDRQGGAR
jgi:hypothetical protein